MAGSAETLLWKSEVESRRTCAESGDAVSSQRGFNVVCLGLRRCVATERIWCDTESHRRINDLGG